jgi:hypothetical protein
MLTKLWSGTVGDSVGAVMITGTPGRTEGMTNTDTLRAARLFRFELFFLADTSICMADSTTTADNAMIDIRTGLTILILLLRPPVFQRAL